MKSFIILLFSLFIFWNGSLSQNVEFNKIFFPDQKDALKEAIRNLDEGNSNFEKEQYITALEFFLKANKFNPDNAILNYNIGFCYLKTDLKHKALNYLLKAYKLEPDVSLDIEYLIGRCYHLAGNFDTALKYYEIFRTSMSPSEMSESYDMVYKRIEECKNGILLYKTPVRAFADNLGKEINSLYSDHSPLVSADESVLIFTSMREGSVGSKIDLYDNQYDEDIYISYNVNDQWQKPENLGEPVNTSINDATVGVSPDGQQLLVYNGNKNNGDIQVCKLEGAFWSEPKSLPKPINSEYCESSASFSPDGNTLYFVSDRPEGVGGKDIWICSRDKEQKWGQAFNLGHVINTPNDEESVFIHPDGVTLYFSSKGHNTMGGYDIFRTSKMESGQWSKPENMGYPINSPDDDICFVLAANGRNGYFSSLRKGGFGRYDLFKVFFLGPEKPLIQSNEDNLISGIITPISESVIEKSVEIKTIRLTIVKGIVKDALSLNPLAAEIEIVDNDKNQIISTSQTNSKTGKFLVSLPSGKNYGLTVKATDYLFHSENFNIPPAKEYHDTTMEIVLSSIKKDVKIILKNVFFEPNSATLNPSSYAELGRLTKLLNDLPTLRIEISGHTDNIGSAEYNRKLSENRAKSVVDFLIQEGIPSARLEFKGYGLTQPIAPNDKEDGRAQNRRVEFKILGE